MTATRTVVGTLGCWAVLCMLAAPADAGSARIDHPAGLDPQAVFTGGGEENNVQVFRRVPPDVDDPITYQFADAHPIAVGAGAGGRTAPRTRR